MKIIQVAPYFYPHIGGVESYVMDLSIELKKRGHEVTVVTAKLPGLKEKEEVNGLDIVRVKPLFMGFTTPIMPNLKKTMMDLDADVVHGNLPPPITAYYAGKVCKHKGMPFILTYHCDVELPTALGGVAVKLYRRTWGKKTLEYADKLIVTSKSYSATSRDVWHKEHIIVPNAVDTEIFNPKNDGTQIRDRYGIGDKGMVLYVGRLVYHKGLEHLVRAAMDVDNAKFVIVGKGEIRPKLERMIEQNNLQAKVVLAGKVPEGELPQFYAAADVSVLPSVARLEAFGIVTLEALASGTPAVVSNIPGVREVIEEGKDGLHAEPMNPIDLAEKINTLLADAGLRKRMGEYGRKRVVEKFRYAGIAEQMEQIYREMIIGE
jgi:glycosyltransferase involved in cell wall biosynthesis